MQAATTKAQPEGHPLCWSPGKAHKEIFLNESTSQQRSPCKAMANSSTELPRSLEMPIPSTPGVCIPVEGLSWESTSGVHRERLSCRPLAPIKGCKMQTNTFSSMGTKWGAKTCIQLRAARGLGDTNFLRREGQKNKWVWWNPQELPLEIKARENGDVSWAEKWSQSWALKEQSFVFLQEPLLCVSVCVHHFKHLGRCICHRLSFRKESASPGCAWSRRASVAHAEGLKQNDAMCETRQCVNHWRAQSAEIYKAASLEHSTFFNTLIKSIFYAFIP